MYFLLCLTLAVSTVAGQYQRRDYNGGYEPQQQQQQQQQYRPAPTAAYQEPASYSQQPQPLILMHKQALTHDGGFNYAFAADNGLKQGESIAPDGTRTGAYQYVDPNGKTISVKYTAGKDGFKILEGDHIPKAPVQQPSPQAAYAQPAYTPKSQYQSYQAPAPQYSNYGAASEDDGQYREEAYERAAPAAYTGPQTFTPAASAKYTAPRPVQYATNAVQNNDYSVEPGKPHTFGNGYSFEFAG